MLNEIIKILGVWFACANPGSVSGTAYSSPALPGMIPEHRTKSNAWAPLDTGKKKLTLLRKLAKW